jgi:hypothetical protein
MPGIDLPGSLKPKEHTQANPQDGQCRRDHQPSSPAGRCRRPPEIPEAEAKDQTQEGEAGEADCRDDEDQGDLVENQVVAEIHLLAQEQVKQRHSLKGHYHKSPGMLQERFILTRTAVPSWGSPLAVFGTDLLDLLGGQLT